MSCGLGHRRGLDPVFLWLWCRPVATTPIGPLAWEPPYAAGAAQGIATTTTTKTKKKKQKTKKQKTNLQLPKGKGGGEGRMRSSALADKTTKYGSSVVAQWLMNPNRNHEVAGSIPGLAHWVKDRAWP